MNSNGVLFVMLLDFWYIITQAWGLTGFYIGVVFCDKCLWQWQWLYLPWQPWANRTNPICVAFHKVTKGSFAHRQQISQQHSFNWKKYYLFKTPLLAAALLCYYLCKHSLRQAKPLLLLKGFKLLCGISMKQKGHRYILDYSIEI